MHKKDSITFEENERVKEYMKDCFAIQRVFLNDQQNVPTAEAIKNNWPYLFEKEFIYQHFMQLMSVNIEDFVKTFDAEKENMIKFFKSSTRKQLSSMVSCNADDILKAIAKYFNENAEYLFSKFEIGCTLEEISEKIPTNAPWIAMVDTSDVHQVAYIYFERTAVAKRNEFALTDLIAEVICYYYTYTINIMNPKEISQTMEFLVRFFFK